ncbi:MAG TPA: arsenate reductase (glutaredoxin) [Candidatus Thioglobus sp.]|jgi:arsenate reductase|nr:arsenate reductase (glutaredoxin) [Candidatus Thioglobus sp.]HIL21611.1 arsenate reductase (glutaredoxin) [Candidatus Thioglobus sp.]
MTTKIYHNARCSKSRATLAILEQNNKEFEIINYLEAPPNEAELVSLLSGLGLSARELMRTGEAEYKAQNLADSSLSEQVLIKAMIATPILIERPIVKTDKGVVIGRPPENALSIL